MKTTFLVVAMVVSSSLFIGIVFADDDRWERRKNPGRLEIYGVIDSMPLDGYQGVWIIDGNRVLVDKSTRIKEEDGDAAAGRLVEIKGYWRDGDFIARKIEIEDGRESEEGEISAKFYGEVEAMPNQALEGVWQINGREVKVTRRTRINEKYGPLAVGAYVEMEGDFSGSSFTVYEIEVKGDKRRDS